MAKIGYATVGSDDLVRARAFYDALLGAIGIHPLFDHPSGGRVYGKDGVLTFAVLGPYNGKPATIGNGGMAGFNFDSPHEVAAFHAAAIALGGTCEGAPGLRGPGYYFTYVRDLDGNKLCGYHIDHDGAG